MVWFVRAMLIAAYPFVMCWAFISTLCREIGMAFWYATNEVRGEHAQLARLWPREVIMKKLEERREQH